MRRRALLEPVEPGSFAERQRDLRHLADRRALPADERAYFAERARSWTAQADALRAEAASLPARGSWAAISRRWRMAAYAPAAAGMALTAAVAIRYDAAWPLLTLIAGFGPPASVPVMRLLRRRECQIAARHLDQDADAITRQLAILPAEGPPRRRRSRWLRACVLLGATACLATTRSAAMLRSFSKPATRRR